MAKEKSTTTMSDSNSNYKLNDLAKQSNPKELIKAIAQHRFWERDTGNVPASATYENLNYLNFIAMKKTTPSLFMLLAVVIGITSSCNNEPKHEETTVSETTTDSRIATQINDNDREFVAKAASGGLMEVELGKLAQQNGSSKRVKDYGGMLERDHSKANDELMAIASAKNIPIPTSMNEHHRSMVENMQKKKGIDFDKAYIDMMVSDHNKDIDAFKSESDHSKDNDLRTFAATTLPVLQLHLDSAEAIHKGMK